MQSNSSNTSVNEMAFIFVPNAEGGFDEGDRQTNPDTGVEYIYIESAWRPLGPSIEEQFPTLDPRYVNKDGDTMTGGLTLSRARNLTFKKEDPQTNQFAINPNILVDYFTNIYAFNGDGMRFRVSQDQSVGDYDTLISLTGETQEIGDRSYRGIAYINRVRTPYNDDHAANKWYVDNAIAENGGGDGDYLPLAGGTMTGDLNMDSADIEMKGSRIDFYNNAGEKTMEIAQSGFIQSLDMLRVLRDDGGPILEGRTSASAADITTRINGDGSFMFKDRGEIHGDVVLKNNKSFIVQGSNNTSVAYFKAFDNTTAELATGSTARSINIKNLSDPVADNDAVHKRYAERNFLSKSGTQDLDTNQWRIRQVNQSGSNNTFVQIYDAEMHLYNVATPTSAKHGANKQYVDDQVAAGGGGSFSVGDAVAKNTTASHSTKGSFYESNGTLYYVHY